MRPTQPQRALADTGRMQDATETAISHLVATTFSSLADALGKVRLDGPPLVRTPAIDRAIEALAGYAIGVFAAGVAARLTLGADLAAAAVIRAALYRATSSAALTAPPPVIHRLEPAGAIDIDALFDEDRVVTPVALRKRVADRLRGGRGDARRIIAALATASAADPAWLARILGELAQGDLVATRFTEQIERVWSRMHGGTTYVAPPKPIRAAPVDSFCWMQIR